MKLATSMRRWPTIALAVCLAVASAGCGDDDAGGASPPAPSPTGSATPTATSSRTATATSSRTPTAELPPTASPSPTGTSTATATTTLPPGVQALHRGSRYCELLLVRLRGTVLEAQVWGTQGLGDCPAARWQALDPGTIRSETGAFAVVLNGPRYWLPNSTTGELPRMERMTFGELEMRFLATVEVDPRQGNTPYLERVVHRSTTFTFDAGEEIYELTSPEGVVYVMQAMSQIVDPDLAFADLSTLGERLALPAGWDYRARTLESPLVLTVEGQAIVLQDELLNTYQRAG